MKKTILTICSITIAATSFAQIKTLNNINKSRTVAKPSQPLIAIGANSDSIEVKKLYEEYKAAEAIANEAFNKWAAKVKAMQAKNSNGSAGEEMNMVKLKNYMEERTKSQAMISNLMKRMEESRNTIINNIK